MEHIPIALIDHRQFRIAPPQVEDVSLSFARHGQFSPICVRRHPTKSQRYQLIFGNRRLEAARKLGWKTIEANVIEANDDTMLFIAFSENSDQSDFTDYEKALLLENIHRQTGKSYQEIATMIGRSNAFVSQHVAMLNLFPLGVASEEERIKVLAALTENHARILSNIEDPRDRWNAAKLVVRSKMGVRELIKLYSRSPGKHTK